MKPLKLKLGAFGSFADETVLAFSELGGNGLYLITGETGSGKTTIFDAISYALFGKASGKARSNYRMLRSDYAEGRTKTFVELEFLSGGEGYHIRREIIPHVARKTGEVSYTDGVFLTLPDGTVLDRGREVDSRITEIVGLDRDQFAQIVMIAQNDFLHFLQSGTEERVKILRRIFNTGRLKAFQEGLKLRARDKETAYKAILREFEKYGIDHNNARQQFAQWGQEIADDSAAVLRADREMQAIDKAKTDSAAKIAVAEELCKTVEALTLQRGFLDAHTARAGEINTLARQKERGETALRKVKAPADKYAEAEATHKKAQADLKTAKSNAEAATHALHQADNEVAALPPLENMQAAFDALKQEWQAVANQLEELAALRENETAIAEKQAAWDRAQAELTQIKGFRAGLPAADAAKEALDRLARALEQETRKLQTLTALREEHQTILGRQQELSERQGALNALLATIDGLPPFETVRQQFEQLSSDSEQADNRLTALIALQSERASIAEKERCLAGEQAELLRLKNTYDCAREKYDILHEQFILGQAGILAATLRKGQPCPVCGSEHHPTPAPPPSGEISGDRLRDLLTESETAKDAVDRKSAQCNTIGSEIALRIQQFNTALRADSPGGSYEHAADLLTQEIAVAETRARALAEKKRGDERALAALAAQIEATARQKEELLPLCAALLSQVNTMREKFLKNAAAVLLDLSWEGMESELPNLLHMVQTEVEGMRDRQSADEMAFAKLKEDWAQSDRKEQQWSATCLKLAAAVSTLTERFLQDLAKYIPGVTWDNAHAALASLLLKTQSKTAELTAQRNAGEVALSALNAQWEAARQKQSSCNTQLERANARLEEREKYAQGCDSQREAAQAFFTSALATNGFADEADYAAAVISEETLAEMARQLADYAEDGRRIRQDIDRLEKNTQGREKPDLEQLNSAFEALKLASKQLRLERDETKLRLENKQRILKELEKSSQALTVVEQEFAAVKTLSDTANGKLDFETYAQMAYFERVLRAANLRLKVMSQNRYTLLRKEERSDGRKRMGLDIEVTDGYTGKNRSADSLSGGESFMASLSLALGLSDVVQHSVGGIYLDAMFIDEGFGSLDAEVLELAVRILSDMAHGNRTIGIISHVSELRERIDKQVHVEKTHSGSKIHLVV